MESTTWPWPSHSTEARLEAPFGEVVLTYEPLDVTKITALVADPGAGATVVFVGTTRNSFKGREVTRLDYQAYSKLAVKTIKDIVESSQEQFGQKSPIIYCAVYHRLGTVPVLRPSVVIAVSSAHRREAFEANEFILEQLKARAQIWKREFYKGDREEDAEWKSNNS